MNSKNMVFIPFHHNLFNIQMFTGYTQNIITERFQVDLCGLLIGMTHHFLQAESHWFKLSERSERTHEPKANNPVAPTKKSVILQNFSTVLNDFQVELTDGKNKFFRRNRDAFLHLHPAGPGAGTGFIT